MSNEAINSIAKRHGHELDWSDRLERQVCVRCEAAAGSDAGNRICPRAEWLHINVHRNEMQALVNNIGNTTGGAKMRRKVNQIYGRQMKDLERAAKKELDKAVQARLAQMESAMKPKPKWVPTIVWNLLLDTVLKRDIMV